MASVELFQATPSLKRAATLINNLEGGKFARILARVLQKLHLKDERAFTSEEEEKLQVALQVDARELELVLNTTTFVLQQAAYHLAKVPLLEQHLKAIGLDDDKVQVFKQAWSSHGKSVIERLRARKFYPKQLEEVNWRLNLQMAQSSRSKMKLPNALIEFVVSDGEEKEKIRLDFTHEELYDLYQKLEAIQGQLDTLT